VIVSLDGGVVRVVLPQLSVVPCEICALYAVAAVKRLFQLGRSDLQ
jgi:hypothetical protein